MNIVRATVFHVSPQVSADAGARLCQLQSPQLSLALSGLLLLATGCRA